MNISNTALLTVAGGAIAGIAGGIALERRTHDRLETRQDEHAYRMAEGEAWVDDANRHFGDEIVADRQRNRDLDAQIEDYKIANEPPDGVTFGRGSSWRGATQLQAPDREGFWFGMIGGGALAGVVAGGALGGTMSAASRGGVIAAGIGVGLIGGAMAGSIVSSWTH